MTPPPAEAAPEMLTPDICVIGAGAAGLSVASTAALLGVSVVLVERGAMGGDCLNAGCVPSKAMIAAANTAATMRGAGRFGIKAVKPAINHDALLDHIGDVIGEIAPVDSVERYRALGVRVIQESARFTDSRTVEAGGIRICARRFVIATGAGAAIPPIPGLTDVPYLTNETIFKIPETPKRLVIIGGGPIGMELAQAHQRLGCDVTIIEGAHILRNEDPELADVARRALLRDGVRILEGTKILRVQQAGSGVTLDIERESGPAMLNASHILVATGRRPRLEDLNLEKAGVQFSPAGITVGNDLKTSNRRIYAIGDCCGGPQFTHAAGYQAGLVIRSVLFRQSVRTNYDTLPRVTYTAPEIATVGLSEEAARKAHRNVLTLRFPFSENDRARTEGHTEGLVKVTVDGKGRILGAAIAGAHAGEMISLWTLAIGQGLRIGAIADTVFPYPTFSEASKRAALQSFAPKLRSPWLPRILRFLRMFG